MGFNVVPMAINEVLVAFQSGMASAVYGPPMATAAYQWFSQAPYMLDFPLAPIIGGIVISERTWRRIPERFHREFRTAINEVAMEFYQESEHLNSEAIRVMEKNGLEVLELSEGETEEWFQMITDGHSLVVGEGKWIDEDVYDELISALEGLR